VKFSIPQSEPKRPSSVGKTLAFSAAHHCVAGIALTNRRWGEKRAIAVTLGLTSTHFPFSHHLISRTFITVFCFIANALKNSSSPNLALPPALFDMGPFLTDAAATKTDTDNATSCEMHRVGVEWWRPDTDILLSPRVPELASHLYLIESRRRRGLPLINST